MHEIHAQAEEWAPTMLFALAAAGGNIGERNNGGAIVVVRMRRQAAMAMQLYGEGLAGLGIDLARLLIVETRNEQELLRVGLDAARIPTLAAVVLETWGATPGYDLIASRRLVLAAERSRASVVVLRGNAQPRASAAHSRWSIRTAPSRALAARAPGGPAIEARLLRRRGGPSGMCWRLEWNSEHGAFLEDHAALVRSGAPLSGLVVPMAGLRAGETRSRAA